MQMKHSRMLNIFVTLLGRTLNSQINKRTVCIYMKDIFICQEKYHSNNTLVTLQFLA